MLLEENDLEKNKFLDGQILLFNKPLEWTSFDLVKKTRNLIKQKFKLKKIKVGHAGTLDPLATGLMIICTGKFTKKITEFQDLQKTYIAEILLGSTTPSFDLETEINQRFSINKITEQDVVKALETFKGEIDQIPPIYSAIKVNGERLYAKARRGDDVIIKSRKITIYSIKILDMSLPKLKIEIVCSKGTYIRSIANDLGLKLNNGGHLISLSRSAIGNYNLKSSFSIKDFEKQLNS